MRRSLNFADLPPWRVVVICFSLALFCFLGLMATQREITIYVSSPGMPEPAAGRIYPLYVMHGSLRYGTSDELERAYFWRKEMGPLIPLPFLIAVLLLITAKESSSRPSA